MRLVLILFAVISATFAAPEDAVPKKEEGISDKSSLLTLDEEHDLLKAESQDVPSEVKPLYQGLFNGKVDGNLPVVVPHPGPRQAPAQPGLPNIFSNGQGPVYQPGGGLAASASHVIENTVEYGPEITGPNAGGPAASGVGQPQVQPQPPQINGQPSSHPHPQAPGLPVPPQYQGQAQAGQVQPQAGQGGNEPWPLIAPDTPKIIHLDVKCEKNLMKVAVEFDKPFNGIIFSKGHYSHGNCVHQPPNSGKNSIYFDIGINSCGTTGNTQNGLYGNGAQTGSGTFFENTVVIQYDPQVQEVWDQARKLRCTWHDQYEKSVTFRPFPVDMLDVVRADFAGDNVGCWMQIQVGKGPWASEVAGIVKIGQTMTIVLAIKDEENKFDMLVRNCIAHDGKRAPIELVDSQGCIVRPKIMSKFTKIKNFGSSASVLSYAHFQAFKFPDSMEVHFQCTIQICRYQCPDQCSQSQQPGQPHPDSSGESYSSSSIFHTVLKAREERRRRRDTVEFESSEIGLDKVIQVVSTGDLAFNLASGNQSSSYVNDEADFAFQRMDSDVICMSTIGFTASAFILSSLLVATCLVAVFFCMKATQVKRKRMAATSNCVSRS